MLIIPQNFLKMSTCKNLIITRPIQLFGGESMETGKRIDIFFNMIWITYRYDINKPFVEKWSENEEEVEVVKCNGQ